MELYIYIEYLSDNHPIGVYVNGVKEYESYKRWCKRHKHPIVKSYICAYSKPETIFGMGERIATTEDVDCAKIQF